MNYSIIRKIIIAQLFVVASLQAMPLPQQAPVIQSESIVFNTLDLTSRNASWGVNPNNSASINLPSAWKNFTKKKDVVVAVVDTGIDPQHPLISKNIYVENGKVDANNFGVDFSFGKSNEKKPLDTNGHGSHIAGIIRSINPGVLILPLKYYNEDASGEDNLKSTINALRYAIDHNVDVINYSAGGAGASDAELAVLKEAEKKGIIVIVAAGNKESNIDIKSNAYFPASYGLKNLIAVTAHNENLTILGSSNYGVQSVDIAAPGERIKSSLQNGRTGFLTGTSQATAFVTGVVSLIKSEFPNLTTQEIREIIKNSAKKEPGMAGKCASGGRLDAGAALSLAEKISNGTPSTRQLAAQ